MQLKSWNDISFKEFDNFFALIWLIKRISKLGHIEVNFIDDRELANRFRENSVPSRERLYYFLVPLILPSIVSFPLILDIWQFKFNIWDVCLHIFTIMIFLFGTIFLFDTNRKGDDTEFIERFVCIGFPVAIQAFIGVIILNVIAAIFDNRALSDESTVYDVVIWPLVMIYFYLRLNSSIRIASH